MFSDIFYLSSLMNLSLAFSSKEKQEIFNESRNNPEFCIKAIKILEKEVQNLANIHEARKTKLSRLNSRTLNKTEIIEEIEYAKALKNRLDAIKDIELQDNSELCQD